MKKIKVVHLITSLRMGGAEIFLGDLLAHMDTTLYEHHVVYFHPGIQVSSLLIGTSIHLYQIRGLVACYDPVFWIRLFRTIKTIQPDLIHTILASSHIAGRLIGRILRIPVISALHSHAEVYADHRWLMRTFQACTVTWSQKTVAVSHAIALDLLHRYRCLAADSVHVITNGIDIHKITQEAKQRPITRTAIRCTEQHTVFGTVGRFVPLKNQQLLITSFAQLSQRFDQARLVLVGYGPAEHELRELVRRHGLEDKVTFIIGQSSRPLYQLFDCFVLTSFSEGMSIALLEAMSQKVPVLVTAPAGSHEVVTSGENGLLVELTQASVVQAMERVMTDDTLKGRLSRQGYETVCALFTIHKTANNYGAIFQRVINEFSLQTSVKKN